MFAKQYLMVTFVVIRGRYTRKKLVGGVRATSRNSHPIKPKICNFPYFIHDMTKTLLPYLRPDP